MRKTSNKQNKNPRRTTNSLEKAAFTTSSSYRREKSPTRIPSTTKQTSTDRNKEIEDLRNQIKLLKQNQKEHDTQEQPKRTENKEEHPEPKNMQVSSAPGGHTQTNIDQLKVQNFVQETM